MGTGYFFRDNDSYKEQMAQKAAFETVIESWKSRAMSNKRRDDDIKSFTRKLSKSLAQVPLLWY